jgi:hypothetical protein
MNNQGCTYPGHQVAKFTKFCTLAPNIGETRVWGLLHVIVQASIILNWLPDFWKIYVILISGVPRNFFRRVGVGSTNSVEDRGLIERGSGGGSPLVRGSAQFANG